MGGATFSTSRTNQSIINPKAKLLLAGVFAASLLAPASQAGDYGKNPIDKVVVDDDPWAKAIRPITNPTLFDLAIPQTQLHPIFM